jgi:hypothetical protein
MQPDADTKEDHAAEVAPDVDPRAPWRVSRVEVLPGFRLRVRFNDGTEGTVEMAEFINSPAAGVFAVLQDENRFQEVKVVMGAVTWPGDLDLAPDAMHRAINESGIWILP